MTHYKGRPGTAAINRIKKAKKDTEKAKDAYNEALQAQAAEEKQARDLGLVTDSSDDEKESRRVVAPPSALRIAQKMQRLIRSYDPQGVALDVAHSLPGSRPRLSATSPCASVCCDTGAEELEFGQRRSAHHFHLEPRSCSQTAKQRRRHDHHTRKPESQRRSMEGPRRGAVADSTKDS
jgi:hypothetical protein